MGIKLLTFGLSPTGIKSISEVANGLSCGCICPSCKEPLIAKNNLQNTKQAHFAHSSGSECAAAFESALHLLAKDVLLEIKQIKTPVYTYKSYSRQGQLVQFEKVLLEEEMGVHNHKIRVDAIGYIKEKKLLIEFAKTHFVDEKKKDAIQRIKAPCIEIDLSLLELDREVLKSKFLSGGSFMYWINNPSEYVKGTNHEQKIERLRKEEFEKGQLNEHLENEKIRARYMEIVRTQTQKVFKTWKGYSGKCPLQSDITKLFARSPYYPTSILKKIVGGATWNGVIYGRYPGERFIYLNGNVTAVLPCQKDQENLPPKNLAQAKFDYKCLKTVEEAYRPSGQCYCKGCKHHAEFLSFDDSTYTVCNL